MNVPKINEAIENVKSNAGNGLVAMDIWSKGDGIPITGHNSQPQAAALCNKIYSQLVAAMKGANFPSDVSDYTIRVADGKMILVGLIADTDYMYGMLMDTKLTQLGLIINVIAPTFIREVGEAVKS